MQNGKSEAERSLEKILRDPAPTIINCLVDLLPEGSIAQKTQQIKRNITDFIESCFLNNKLVLEMIERGVKSVDYASDYHKKLALFSIEMMSGDYGDSYKLFIQGEERRELLKSRGLNEPEIQEEIEAQSLTSSDCFAKKYSNFMVLLEYIRKDSSQISETNMNYFVKILANIISYKAEDVFAYFTEDQRSKQKSPQPSKSDIDYLIDHSYYFGGVSELMAKMVAEEGPANNYLEMKNSIIGKYLEKIKNKEVIRSDSVNYFYLLQFPGYLLSRTKYKSDDSNEQIANITQKFVDHSVINFFKEKLVKAVIESNGLLSSVNMNSSGHNKSESSKSLKKQKEHELRSENEEEFHEHEVVFGNCLQFLKMIAQRINAQQEIEASNGQTDKPPEPTMDFQVNETLFGCSLFQLLTIQLPFIYKSLNKMTYYEFLLKLTRNNRYQKSSMETGLDNSSFITILVHLLKIFKRESRRNGLVNLYIEQLIQQAILPKISNFEKKEGFMVLSAFNPEQEIIAQFDDTRSFTQKLFYVMAKKWDWFGEHSKKLGIDLEVIRQNFTTKLGNHDSGYQNRKYTTKELLFLAGEGKPLEKPALKIEKSERMEDDLDSSDSDEELKDWNLFRKENIVIKKREDAEKPQIPEQIRISFSEEEQEQKRTLKVLRKESQIELMVDSAEEDQDDDMKPEASS